MVLPLRHAASFVYAAPMHLTVHRAEDAFIGLSCIAIASTLGSFLLTANRSIPFRTILIALTACTTMAGLCTLLSATLISSQHPVLTSQAPLFGAILALLAACLLPFLLPLLLSKSRELASVQQAALQHQTRFLAATQSSSDAFMLLDTVRSPDGTIEDFLFSYLNANAEKLIQLPAGEVIGARITHILPLSPTDRLFQQYRQVVLTGQPLIHEFPLEAGSSTSLWMRHHVARVGEDAESGLAITASDITERKHAELNLPAPGLECDSQHDALTGLPNRRLLDDRLQQAIARADRYRNRVALILVNLDSFDTFNQLHGRQRGDITLRVIGGRLRSAIRATDSVLRLEGDEFVVLMPDMKKEVDIRRAAATLVAILREPIVVEGHSVRVSCSLGVTAYPDTDVTAHELLQAAEEALVQAKRNGRNQYVLKTQCRDGAPDENEDEPNGDSFRQSAD